MESGVNELLDPPLEVGDVKRFGVAANYQGIELIGLEGGHDFGQRARAALVEEQAGDAINHAGQGAARAIGNDRATTCLSLQRCQAKIFGAGMNERLAAREIFL